jgi:molybdenum cofactor cytidylyltransferase
MGRPKALLPWGDYPTLIAYQVDQLARAGCDLVIAVTGAAADEVGRAAKAAGATLAHNERWQEGRAGSLRVGAEAAPGETEIVVVLGVDQPRPSAVTERLLAAIRHNPAVPYVPTYKGRRGHPVVLPGKYLGELREVDEETQGLRALIEAYPPAEIDMDEPLVTADLNTPEEYERWLAAGFTSPQRETAPEAEPPPGP